MDSFKQFLKKKKVEKHFKHTGPGQKLSSDSSTPVPSIVTGSAQGSSVDRIAASDVAAQAALKRFAKIDTPQKTYSQRKIEEMAEKMREEERMRDPEYALAKLSLEPPREPEVKEFEHSDAIAGVYFTCDFFGDCATFTKKELLSEIEQFLMNQIINPDVDGDSLISAVLLLFSVNTKEASEIAVQTICTYVQNVLDHPTEEKYRKIRVGNENFQKRVLSAKGALEVLKAIGFTEIMDNFQQECVPFLQMSSDAAGNSERLIYSLETLCNGECVPIRVSRNTKIFQMKENEKIKTPHLSNDFFDLTSEEIKREQESRKVEVDQMTSLRTREMRERDAKLRVYSYKYSLIRIRLPDGYVVQGTFGVNESVESIKHFLCEVLTQEALQSLWTVRDPTRPSFNLRDSCTLTDEGLAPAVILHLEYDQGYSGPSLSEKFFSEVTSFPG